MKRIFTVMICAVMIFAFSACGNTKNVESNGAVESAVGESSKMFVSVEDYVNAEQMQKAIEDMKKSLSATYDFDCVAEGESLVYVYRYIETVGEDALPQIKKAFDDKFEEMKPTVKQLMRQIIDNVDVQEPKVVLRFCNSDGSVISEKSFDKTVVS